ncbi:MAG: hypothetical protein ABRQ39_05235 [Candidatus Eremiobacterota bacterium]
MAEEELYDDYWITDKAQTVHHIDITYQLRAKYPVKVQVPLSRVYEYYNPEHVTETKPFEIVVE